MEYEKIGEIKKRLKKEFEEKEMILLDKFNASLDYIKQEKINEKVDKIAQKEYPKSWFYPAVKRKIRYIILEEMLKIRGLK